MKIITFRDIVELGIGPIECYEWTKKMIENKNKTFLPPKICMGESNGDFCTFMPSIIQDENEIGWEGVKVVTRIIDRVPSLNSRILLLNQDNKEFCALMDGTWITAMRTGGVAAHSVALFAKNDFSVIGMMGLGNVLRSTLSIIAELYPNRELTIKLLQYKEQEKDFIKRFSDKSNLRFMCVDSPEKMVKGSDVVISGATYLPDDICDDCAFDKGVLVQPIHTRGFTNCDLFFDKVYVDDINHVKSFKNYRRFKTVNEVCDVVNGVKAGRESDDERILSYNVGISIHDIYFATKIYQIMDSKGILEDLPDVDLDEPTEKFWV